MLQLRSRLPEYRFGQPDTKSGTKIVVLRKFIVIAETFGAFSNQSRCDLPLISVSYTHLDVYKRQE